MKFLHKNIFTRFGVPRALISDEGSHFDNKLTAKALQRYGVRHRIATAYHPPTNGRAEVSNRKIKQILEKTVITNRKDWSPKLDEALWPYCTALKTPLGMSPFNIVYGKACHLPIELEHKAFGAIKKLNTDAELAGERRLLELNELEEFRSQAYESPFIIHKVHPYVAVEIKKNEGDMSFKVNGQRLKVYNGAPILQERCTSEEMPDAAEPLALAFDTSVPHRRLKRKANRNIIMADLAAKHDATSNNEEDNGPNTTPEETPMTSPPQSNAPYKRADQEEKSIATLRQHKEALGWTIADIKGISPTICMHKILLDDDHKPTVDAQRHLNQAMKDVVRKEILKWLDACIIYHISDSEWVSPVQCVPKKGGITVISNEKNELIPTRKVTGWRVCMDYRKLNKATRKDHFPLPYIDQMLDRLAGKQFYCFLDGYSSYNQIAIAPEDQSKTTFTCPYGTFAFRRMPFGLCNAPATFQQVHDCHLF
ncbi:hypothetical protein GQ457_15G015960 [Hibiscus cannabinus]